MASIKDRLGRVGHALEGAPPTAAVALAEKVPDIAGRALGVAGGVAAVAAETLVDGAITWRRIRKETKGEPFKDARATKAAIGVGVRAGLLGGAAILSATYGAVPLAIVGGGLLLKEVGQELGKSYLSRRRTKRIAALQAKQN